MIVIPADAVSLARVYSPGVNERLASLFGAPLRSRVIDRGVVVLIALFGLGSVIAIRGAGLSPYTRLAAVAVCVAALTVRHRRPLTVLAIVLAVTLTA